MNQQYTITDLKSQLAANIEYKKRIHDRLQKANHQAIEMGRKQLTITDHQDTLTRVKETYDAVKQRIDELEMERKRPAQVTIAYMASSVPAQSMKVKFTVENTDFGELGSADKIYSFGLPKGLPYEVFDNREFDQYNSTSSTTDLLNNAMQTGMLPPGTYDYYITVYDENDSVIGQDHGVNIVTNMLTSIDLIGPGNSMDFSPETIFTPNPYFQWFSTAVSYDMQLFKVMEGQTSADEITSNLPEFEISNFGLTELLYPNYAEFLVPGKTYAWQVKAYFEGSMGQEIVYSDVVWFNYEEGGNNIIDHIEISPEVITVYTNESYQFHAYGFDSKNDTVPINCNWFVIPNSAGTIDNTGLFTAGSDPVTLAVVAEYNGVQVYSTVSLEWNGLSNNYFDFFIKKVYGIPNN